MDFTRTRAPRQLSYKLSGPRYHHDCVWYVAIYPFCSECNFTLFENDLAPSKASKYHPVHNHGSTSFALDIAVSALHHDFM